MNEINKPKYVTGQRFKAKINGTPVEGKIYVDEKRELIYLLQNEVKGNNQKFISDLMGYKDGWCINHGDEKELEYDSIRVTDLELLPDPTEPVKGDITDRWIEFTGKPQEAPNVDMWLLSKEGEVRFSPQGEFVEIGYHTHYMIAQKPLPPPIPSPEQSARQEAEKKADEFIHWYNNNTDPVYRSRKGALTEYILKEKM